MKYAHVLKVKPLLKKLASGPLRWLVLIVYRPLVFIELWFEKRLDQTSKKEPPDLENVTAVIKTFERPGKLKALVNSIHSLYPELKIIVVDDSKSPSALGGVTMITLPFDSGVSAGRAAGLEKVDTPFILNLDDDFVFNRHTSIESSLAYLNQYPEIDLVGGEVTYLPFYYTHNYSNIGLMGRQDTQRKSPHNEIGGLKVLDKTSNFFLARTDAIKNVGWDPKLKRMDHGDFFTRAKGEITTVFNPQMGLLHVPSYFNRIYMDRKYDTAHDSSVLWMRYGRK